LCNGLDGENYSNQMKKYFSKITVLVYMATFESYGSSSENFLLLLC